MSTLAHVTQSLLVGCGIPYPHSIANAPFVAYTDFWAAYAAVLPGANDIAQSARKRALTTYIERFNNTLRPRVSRLVQKTLSFSKSLENHIGAIWYFINHYNTSLLV
ncbi:IS1 family transposase [Microcoleus sp. B3-D7]|uniref:IS1 family transposase n=1 Tax=Microcoleus sp. B3-D7 TaxID=2818659 RepID=UPI00403F9633